MKPPTMPCPKCQGKGQLNLPPRFAEFYNVLVKLGPSGIGDISKALGWTCSPSLPSKYVARLEKVGLVKKVNPGERWPIYKAV